jgi:hypothetical protein
MIDEWKKVTQTFNVTRKRSRWDRFIDFITFHRRSVVQEVEINFLFKSDVDIEEVSVIISGLYLVEAKPTKRQIVDF